jgi:predicted RNase H-like HicB family nuclease
VTTPHYHINLFWSHEDDCWIADVPDLRSCSAHGETPDEAIAEIKVAMQLYLDSLTDHGDPIPEPRYRPAIYAARAA